MVYFIYILHVVKTHADSLLKCQDTVLIREKILSFRIHKIILVF